MRVFYSNIKLGLSYRKCIKRHLHLLPESYIITTPIFYVNGAPHLGHLYSAVIADASHRFHKLLGVNKTIFSTGTDEHGLKIHQAAEKSGKEVQQFCDNISAQFHLLFQKSSVGFTRYIRTTDEDHIKTVCQFWNKLVSNNHIYVGKYAGWYCTSDETFVKENDLKEMVGRNGKNYKISIESGHKVEWIEESNYMFKLSNFKSDLLCWLRQDVIYPKKFGEILIKYCEEDLDDLSVSRSRSRLQWGIPVPNDNTQTIYVWLDALVNYLTVCGYAAAGNSFAWPPAVQIIGKDILKFHGLYWPALLMAANLEPPRKLFCHSHWTVNNEKMSKSKGNIIDPFQMLADSSCDAVRYFLLAEGVPHSDGNYSSHKFVSMVNSELVNTMGNLLNRCTAKSLNKAQVFPTYNKDSIKGTSVDSRNKLVELVEELPDGVKNYYMELNFYKGIGLIMNCLRQANVFIQESKPWELKGDVDQEQLHSVIYVAMETLKTCGILLSPIIPNISRQLLDRLGIPDHQRHWRDSKPFLSRTECHKLGANQTMLFARLKTE